MVLRSFAGATLLLGGALLLIALHSGGYDYDRHRAQLQNAARLCGLPGVSLSTAYYERQRIDYGASVLNSYVELPPIDRMEYLYAR